MPTDLSCFYYRPILPIPPQPSVTCTYTTSCTITAGSYNPYYVSIGNQVYYYVSNGNQVYKAKEFRDTTVSVIDHEQVERSIRDEELLGNRANDLQDSLDSDFGDLF